MTAIYYCRECAKTAGIDLPWGGPEHPISIGACMICDDRVTDVTYAIIDGYTTMELKLCLKPSPRSPTSKACSSSSPSSS